ncbi:hypothetical protein GPECTOR_157g95 [Gonium pectorale]|uniref:Uncharacterized protein n=1 Tax=Gonium pectorale TaxID=33097 RepID=A0A150FXQ5_GONPE|nr:hypothetical protein GPECTOR_157g95 [Gonium pectorale]|eukprot:KXZ42357.1 hypothetical protein GPECTOR_157g95 [Gonium pectorale]
MRRCLKGGQAAPPEPGSALPPAAVQASGASTALVAQEGTGAGYVSPFARVGAAPEEVAAALAETRLSA